MNEPQIEKHRNKGIYLLPNLLTTTALFAGFYAIVSAIEGNFEQASIALFVAMVFDGLDGRVARLMRAQTAFGAEYDSLSDMIAFGLAPALVAFLWGVQDMGKIGWAASFVYVSGAALRLAKFNTQIDDPNIDKRYFYGLASPTAAALIAGSVWVFSSYDLASEWTSLVLTATLIAVGLLMVSNVRYFSFKTLGIKRKVPFIAMPAMIMIFAMVLLEPAIVLLSMAATYTVSGLVIEFWHLKGRKRTKNSQ
ncbi:CDP-diacylglycerol--serine O-phosphatidyltransferase [Salinibius halmophilus]|uniref:CDP-diacylglycerol--serine O-phosphatidyltransferase n=1 Tax=Salinibius halmophilus TaxID=1853216 RepID=UPI000E66A676|nr:CDP-diacylglycerol--serine O-phosphatidyltransferase [Salinibius halmophilus]